MKVRMIALFFLLASFATVNAQTTVKCSFSTMPGDVTIAKMMPKTGTFKMLVVYCKFNDDTFDSPLTAQWPSNMSILPAWTSKTISTTKMDDYTDPSISGYFKEMSGGMNDNDGDGLPDGKLDVIGNVCPILYIPKNNSSYYTTAQGRNISYLTKEVLDGIDPYVNFADYDNDKDGYVDMISICFRSAPTGEMDPSIGKYQGYASLTGSYSSFEAPSSLSELFKDGVRIMAGAFGSGTFQQDIYDPDGQISIICHEMGHYLNLSHTDAVHRHGLMDTNRGGSVMNGYERDLMGWIKPVVISSDATIESGNPITLKDALGNNAIYKIRKSDGLYYYIENHEGKSYYEKSWKSNATETNLNELVMPGKGVLVLEVGGPNSEMVDVKVADGLWNWKKSGSLYVYPFEIESPNPYSGQSELDLYNVQTTAGVKNHPDYKGVQRNYFTTGYNQVFSPKSNPSVGSKANFAMEMIQQYSGGDIQANFYFTNVYAGTPSKPQLLKSVNDSYGQTVLNWYANTEPDITGYKIYKGSTDGVKSLTYNLIATVNGRTTTTWTDDEKTVGNSNWKVYYKVSALDSDGNESVKSDSSYVSVLSSSITVNQILGGKIDFVSDGYVSSGTELNFLAGSTITFKNNSSLTVNGSLNANGATFDFVLDNNQDNGIKVFGSAAISSCKVKNASKGINIGNNAHASLENTDFTDCHYGLYSSKGVFTAKNCNFNCYIGISGSYLDTPADGYNTAIENCSFNSNVCGVLLSYSSPRMNGNSFNSNYTGLNCSNHSSPNFGNGDEYGNTTFRNNYTGIAASYYSNPCLGTTGCINQGGGNTFMSVNVTGTNGYYHIDAQDNCFIEARNNYWDRVKTRGAYVYTYPYSIVQSFAPSSALSLSPEETVYDSEFDRQLPVTDAVKDISGTDKAALNDGNFCLNPGWSLKVKVSCLKNLLLLKKYNILQKHAKEVIKENPDSASSLYALDLLRQASGYDKTRHSDFMSFLGELASIKGKSQIKGEAELMLLLESEKLTSDELEKLRNKYKGGVVEEEILLHELSLFMNSDKDMGKAEGILKDIDQLFPDSRAHSVAHLLLGNASHNEAGLLKSASSEEKKEPGIMASELEIPGKYALIGNYPNPFNPETTIKYALPDESDVELTIYDSMGRLVRTYTTASQQAGIMTLHWNGKDEKGGMVSSGIYIYRLKASSRVNAGKVFEASAKMLLVK